MKDRGVWRTLVLSIAAAAVTGGCMGYVPGRQTYWDAKIRSLCKKDGGFTVFERVRVSKADIEREILPLSWPSGLGQGVPQVGFAPKELAHPEAPVYSVRESETVLREWNPSVVRRQARVQRRNGKVVARYVLYSRGGGDFPSHAHPSGFTCPDIHPMFQEFSKQLFIVE
jgi:hypothetical protein